MTLSVPQRLDSICMDIASINFQRLSEVKDPVF